MPSQNSTGFVCMQHFVSDEIFLKHEATTADFLQSSLAK